MAIKTYSDVSKSTHGFGFGISRMEDIYAQREGKKDDPHRHNFYTVLLVKKAKGMHHIDFNAYSLGDSQVFFISPGQVHQVVEEAQSFGFSIVFSADFLARNNIDPAFIDRLNLFHDFGHVPPLTPTAQELDKLAALGEQMCELNTAELAYKHDALGALLKLLLIHCNNLQCLHQTEAARDEGGNTLLSEYKRLLNEHHAQWHAVADYADALHVSADHLNRVLKTLTGKTAKEHIQSRITVAAKRMLYFSGKSTKEIAFALGFSEPGNFSQFFKKCTGFSPSEFKKNA